MPKKSTTIRVREMHGHYGERPKYVRLIAEAVVFAAVLGLVAWLVLTFVAT
jgi:hypothetical protein